MRYGQSSRGTSPVTTLSHRVRSSGGTVEETPVTPLLVGESVTATDFDMGLRCSHDRPCLTTGRPHPAQGIFSERFFTDQPAEGSTETRSPSLDPRTSTPENLVQRQRPPSPEDSTTTDESEPSTPDPTRTLTGTATVFRREYS